MESPKFTWKQWVLYIIKFTWVYRFITDNYEKGNNPDDSVVSPKEIKSGWSIVVTTTGKDTENLQNLVNSVKSELNGTPYEIVFVGPEKLDLGIDNVPTVYVPFKELNWGIPGWITRKKNLGAKASQYDKLVITHDYIQLMPGWKKGFDTFGNDFEAASNIFINKDGTRHKDWITYDYPGIGRGSLPYHAEATPYQYLNGAYFVVKRKFFMDNLLSEKLRWGESEDIEWSMRIRKITTFKFNINSKITYSKQKPGDNERWQAGTAKLELLFKK